MPYVPKSIYDYLIESRQIRDRLQDNFEAHNEFVKKYEGTMASRCTNTNFAELKGKRDLLHSILFSRKES